MTTVAAGSSEVPLGAALGSPERPPPAERAYGRGRGTRQLASAAQPLVAICMASFDPDPVLFRRQIESIRAQTHGSWVCLISDDGSSHAALAAIEEVIGGDDRFVLSRADANAGFYRNFERALELVPDEVDYVALCDQDDEWRSDKLERLLAGLEPGARLVYSDMRIVDEQRSLISETYWSFRRNNHTDFGSLMLANTVTGAASLFERSLLEHVLPFPPRHAAAYHDHWIAQVAMALGPLSYVDEPLYDYVQHDAAAIGYLTANAGGRYSANPLQRARISLRRLRDRRFHLGWRQPYFNVYCRIALAARVLQMRCGAELAPGRASVIEQLIDPSRAARWLLRRALADGLTDRRDTRARAADGRRPRLERGAAPTPAPGQPDRASCRSRPRPRSWGRWRRPPSGPEGVAEPRRPNLCAQRRIGCSSSRAERKP